MISESSPAASAAHHIHLPQAVFARSRSPPQKINRRACRFNRRHTVLIAHNRTFDEIPGTEMLPSSCGNGERAIE